MTDPIEKCGTCRYWERNRLGQVTSADWAEADCLRHAPKSALRIEGMSHYGERKGYFPVTEAKDWCGDYSRDQRNG